MAPVVSYLELINNLEITQCESFQFLLDDRIEPNGSLKRKSNQTTSVFLRVIKKNEWISFLFLRSVIT